MQKFNTLIKCNQAYAVAKDILFYLNTKNFLHSELKWHSEQRSQADIAQAETGWRQAGSANQEKLGASPPGVSHYALS